MKNIELISNENISIRLMQNTEKDMEFLLQWLSNPQVVKYAYAEGAPWNMDKIVEEFAEKTEEGGSSTPCFIVYNHKEIGYLQYYPIKEDSYAFNSPETFKMLEGGYGLDTFIGEPELWNKGIGSQAINLIKDYLKDKLQIKVLCVDPETDNARAVHFWQKVGFETIDIIKNYDDENKNSFLMMNKL